ncbi:vps-15, partial [Pristionchus pacificus]
ISRNMGNLLTASHPQQLFPLQVYLKDYTFDNTVENLGSTRFMKVARAANSAGCQVWKVFVSPDFSVNLEIYRSEFDRIANSCLLPNCSPFRHIPKLDDANKSVIICRPYHKLTLTERLTTRPFVVPIERIWYTYQLLRALSQCHSVNVCHGDLKSQNVLLSSYGWLHITDFAFFKPTYLPEDDPSVFSYFFDTSRRQTCYIAPERILNPLDYKTKGELSSTKLISEGLTATMDIFSAGCVIYELFSDGHPPFTYGSLIKYRKMSKEDAEKELDDLLTKCSCGSFSPILKRMLSRNPKDRPSASTILSEHANLFPEMITYLYNYINIYRPKDILRSSADDLLSNVMEADDVIAKLLHDKEVISNRLSSPDSPPDSAVFFISLITSNLRAIRTASVRISAMRLVVQLSRYSSASIAIQRVLPYLVSQVEDPDIYRDECRRREQLPSSAVQSFAIECISHLVSPLSPVTFEDSLVFTEYLLPRFNGILERLSVLVLLSLAKYLGRLAECSLEFSRVKKEKRWNREEDETQAESDTDDKKSLCNAMSNLFSSLHSKDNEVKLVLVRPKSLKRLYHFFDVMGTPELLLSHMITMLNETKDWRMRVAFYESLPLVVKTRTIASSGIDSLLQQGLRDQEELVVSRVLSSIRLLSLSGIFTTHILYNTILTDAIPFLIHPNESIRGETAEFIVSLHSILSLPDMHSRILPRVLPYLKTSHPLIGLNNKLVLMESLISPISREVWKELTVLSRKDSVKVFHYIKGNGSGKEITFRDLLDNRDSKSKDEGIKEKLKRMEKIVDGMIEQREKNRGEREWKERGKVDLKDVDKKEFSLIASTKDSFATSGHATMPMSVYDAYVEELLGYKKREVEARIHSFSLPSPSNTGKGAIEKMKGIVVMHLHEHSKGITQLSVNEEGSHVASSSSDGSFKLWSCSQMGGDSYGAVRSDATYSFKSTRDDRSWALTGIGWTGDSQLVVASSSGELLWADTNTEVKEMSRICLPEEDGGIEQIISNGNLTFVRTHHGIFYCYDSRVGKTSNGNGGGKHCVWRKKASNQQAKITSFCIDPHSANWMVTSGTSNKLHVWDMRLLVEVMSFPYTSRKGLPVRVWSTRFATNNFSEPHILVGNSICGEISLFNVTSGLRSDVWWPSHQRKTLDYSNDESTVDLNRAASALCVERNGWVLIGDTKGEIRKWNINEPTKSAFISGISQYQSRGKIKYERKLEDDRGQTVVTYEVNHRSTKDTVRNTGVTEFHRTSISDMVILPMGNSLSAGSDGCIKVWS